MKKALLLFTVLLMSKEAPAQVIAEVFQQGQTQTKYLMQQIAALQVYIGYVQKGYSIAQKGLDDIGKIKNGDLDIHTDYFSSLRSVNPKVREYSKVAAIIRIQLDILKVYRDATDNMAKSRLFSSQEESYAAGVYKKLLDDCAATMDELAAVTTDGKLQMTDDERINRIDKLYSDMQSKYGFVRGFSDQSKLLANARAHDKNDVQAGRAINGIK
jgi:hypothetical protein